MWLSYAAGERDWFRTGVVALIFYVALPPENGALFAGQTGGPTGRIVKGSVPTLLLFLFPFSRTIRYHFSGPSILELEIMADSSPQAATSPKEAVASPKSTASPRSPKSQESVSSAPAPAAKVQEEQQLELGHVSCTRRAHLQAAGWHKYSP